MKTLIIIWLAGWVITMAALLRSAYKIQGKNFINNTGGIETWGLAFLAMLFVWPEVIFDYIRDKLRR